MNFGYYGYELYRLISDPETGLQIWDFLFYFFYTILFWINSVIVDLYLVIAEGITVWMITISIKIKMQIRKIICTLK